MPQETQRGGIGLFKKGDVIGGRYVVHSVLGEGGFGVVYLVEVRDTGAILALKTIHDRWLPSPRHRATFKKESLLWVNLERHPFILNAEWIDEISGRLFVAMEYVAPDHKGRVTLFDHLVKTVVATDVLKWGIEFCMGMEHARSHGMECHRDIKPHNILIAHDGAVKISDFGIALATEAAWQGSKESYHSLITHAAQGGLGRSLIVSGGKERCGTPGYMAPEVYRCEGASVRSDIYSFGLVLWQIAAGSREPPFVVRWTGDMEAYERGIYEQQVTGRVPSLGHPLDAIIERCLRPIPAERYGSFQELREALEPIWLSKTGGKFEAPQVGQQTAGLWINRGAALKALDRHDEALRCYEKALALDTGDARAWVNKGISLSALGRYDGALKSYDKAIAVDPHIAHVWCNKGATLNGLGRHKEAIECFDKALAIDPQDTTAWHNKGVAHRSLSETPDPWASGSSLTEAVRCFEKVLVIDPRNANAWNEKGLAHRAIGRASGDITSCVTALVCFDKALEIEPLYVTALGNKADTLSIAGLNEDAIKCCKQALKIDPQNAALWYTKALSEDGLRQRREAMESYQEFIRLAAPEHAQAIGHAKKRLQELGSKSH